MIVNIKLVKKEMVANETMAFYFEKPKDFTFRAGQFADYTLINPTETDEKGNRRGLSFVEAPFEEYLVAATRMRDTAFKRVLKDMPIGTEVKLDGPYGDFILHKNEDTEAVFIIGGIGVTPVRSMIAQATHDKTNHKIILIHSSKTPSDLPFMTDFNQLAKENLNFTYIPVASDSAPEDWPGEKGRIDEAMIRKYVTGLSTPIYYLSGPEGMVKAMRQLLINTSVSEDNIRTEEFTGY